MNRKGSPNFAAYSAGSHPAGFVRPEALRPDRSGGSEYRGFYSKSWDEFSKPDAPALHFVFTVCDNAANEVCPFWPGQPMTAHWGVPDPCRCTGTPEEIERAFRDTFSILDRRISLFLSLPTLDSRASSPCRRKSTRSGINRCVNEGDSHGMRTFIFACVHNAGRSQMSAAFFNQLADPMARAISAGTQPAEMFIRLLWTQCTRSGSTSAMRSRKN